MGKIPAQKKKRTAVVLMQNEVIRGVLVAVLRRAGYEARHDIESCVEAEFAVIGPYFVELGFHKQIFAANPGLPTVLVSHSVYKANGEGDVFYDIVEVDGRSAIETDEKISRWFFEGPGKFLIQSGGSR